MEPKVRITVWSDYVCPFCYLEEPVLQRIRREYGDAVEVDWRAFELRPEPVPTLDPNGDYLRNAWASSVYPMARERGMKLRLPPVQPRSRKALELAELARSRGRFDAAHQALFRAFFEDGRDLNDIDVLADVAAEAGLDRDQAIDALKKEAYRDKVLQDQREAGELGIHAVPTMIVNRADQALQEASTLTGASAISGAQPYETVRAAVERAKGAR